MKRLALALLLCVACERTPSLAPRVEATPVSAACAQARVASLRWGDSSYRIEAMAERCDARGETILCRTQWRLAAHELRSLLTAERAERVACTGERASH